MNRNGKSLAVAAALAMASMAGLAPSAQPQQVDQQARTARGDRIVVDEMFSLSRAGERNAIAKAMFGGFNFGRSRRFPNGPGWTHAHVARMKSKRRNQQRNKRAHRGGAVMDRRESLCDAAVMEHNTIGEDEVIAATELRQHLLAVAAQESVQPLLPAFPTPQQRRPGVKAHALTLDEIRARCEEFGECWIWQQGVNSAGVPIARSRNKTVPVRREVAYLYHGRETPKGYFVISACQDRLCVAPKCARVLSAGQYVRWLNDTGRFNTPAVAIAKSIAAARRSALSNEAAREVRDSIRAGADRGEVAKRHGISRSYANRIATGRYRNVIARGASIFNL